MKVDIIERTKTFLRVKWSCEEKGFGEISIRAAKDGYLEVDAEYLSIETVIKIIKAI